MIEPGKAVLEEASEKWGRPDTAICLALLGAFLGSRVLWMLTRPRSSAYWEEAYRWVAVEELANGATQPLFDYQADHYQGGSLVVIGLGVLFRLMGTDSLVALKLAALCFSLGTLVALYVVGRVFFSRAVGLLSGLVYLLGPPLVAFWGMVAMGFHAESALLSLVGCGVFLALATEAWRGNLPWFGFGLISGLSIWFTPTAAIGLVAFLLTWPLLAARPRATALAVAACGLCLGLTPWLVYNASHDFAGLGRMLEVFGALASADPWRSQGLLERAGDLFVRAPTQGLLDPGGDSLGAGAAIALTVGVWIPAGVALAAAMRRALGVVRAGRGGGDLESRRELVFLVYAAVFAVAYLGTRFTLDLRPSPIAYRLMVPPAVLLITPVALSAARGLRAGAVTRRLCGIACAAGLVSLFAATVCFAVRHEEPATPLVLERGYVVWGRLVHRKWGPDVDAAVAAARRIPEASKRLGMLRGIGWGIEDSYEQRGSLANLVRSLERIPPPERGTVEGGLRWALGDRRQQLADFLAQREDIDLRRVLTRLDALAEWAEANARPSALGLDGPSSDSTAGGDAAAGRL